MVLLEMIKLEWLVRRVAWRETYKRNDFDSISKRACSKGDDQICSRFLDVVDSFYKIIPWTVGFDSKSSPQDLIP